MKKAIYDLLIKELDSYGKLDNRIRILELLVDLVKDEKPNTYQIPQLCYPSFQYTPTEPNESLPKAQPDVVIGDCPISVTQYNNPIMNGDIE